jgi:ElaB/YqjD/DUF883 family membrane-anchored ribosome-binding protein
MIEATPGNGAVTERLVSLDQEARAFLAAHPIVALACAVGIGFVVGRLLSGRGTK